MDEDRYMIVRDGGMLTSSFQSDVCWFRNLLGRNPGPKSMGDDSLLAYMRRIHLDIMWSLAPGAVSITRSNVKKK